MSSNERARANCMVIVRCARLSPEVATWTGCRVFGSRKHKWMRSFTTTTMKKQYGPRWSSQESARAIRTSRLHAILHSQLLAMALKQWRQCCCSLLWALLLVGRPKGFETVRESPANWTRDNCMEHGTVASARMEVCHPVPE